MEYTVLSQLFNYFLDKYTKSENQQYDKVNNNEIILVFCNYLSVLCPLSKLKNGYIVIKKIYLK